MKPKERLVVLFAILFAASAFASAEPPIQTVRPNLDPPLVDWHTPANSSGLETGRGKLGIQSGSGPDPFYPVTPCRQYDSRTSSPLADGTSRAVTLTGAPCGIPAGTLAVSVNVTVFNIVGATGNGVFKLGISSPPTTAWINYPPTETQRSNAGAAGLTGFGQIIVQVNQGGGQVDFTVDVNGYYYNGNYPVILPTGDFFSIVGASNLHGVIYGANISSTGVAYGMHGYASSSFAGSAGVWGEGVSSSPGVFGVQGTLTIGPSSNPGAAGVYGVDSTSTSGSGGVDKSAGVYGDSVNGYGVLGASRNVGVKGVFLNGSGSLQTVGELGASLTTGVYSIGNLVATGTKSFVDPHPIDPSKAIAYVALEGPESGTYFRGSAQIENGLAVISVPEDFRLVTDPDGLTVQLTPVGSPANMFVVSEDLNQIVVRSNRDVKFHYMVNGVRKAFKDYNPIVENAFFRPESAEAKMPGAYSAEQKRILIQTGIYNSDGTVNVATAKRLGWDKIWEERQRPTPKPQ